MPSFYFNYSSGIKCVNTLIIDFLRNFIPFFNSGFFQRIEIVYLLASICILLQESPDAKAYWVQIWTIVEQWCGFCVFQHFKGKGELGCVGSSSALIE